ncbi:hypothetical protein [Paraliomyxa miuraensis]|uniref:hypothetical protein n=1 Tax=Paraliomyxa miuraensis TaxID=376150 RepID=UPI002253D8C6|nr:hypothetical protein [Paraliomyxa miuraensis]MCX4245121.1 hypothetical protein [Paraliomyxa miuraensis]
MLRIIPAPKSEFPTPTSLVKAFRALEHEIAAVPDDRLLRINLNIPSAVQIGLGVLDRIRGLLPDLAQLPDYDLPRVRELGTYAGAALYAHLRAQQPERGLPRLQSILRDAVPLRACLLAGADALVAVGSMDADQVATIRKGRGHADTANALSALASLYEERWDQLKGRTAVTRAMIRRAAALGPRLHAELGVSRLHPIEPTDDPRRTRARAFTLFSEVYDQCRRGVTFLRWHEGDADQFVPSLYPKRGPRAAPPELDPPTSMPARRPIETLVLAETSIVTR